MPCVLIRHKVANYATWKRAVRSFAKMRKSVGEKSFQAYRSAASPNDLTVICAWDNASKMKKFIKSAELREGMKKCGVLGKPEIQFFGKAEDLSVAK